jgi:RNase P/RNase MRP subunit p30
MPTDVVFPKNNEEHLCEMAKRLGFTHLIFVYDLKDPLLKDREKEIAKLASESFSTEFAIIVTNQQEISKARSICKTIIGIGRPELFEDKRITHIIDFESGKRDDFIHHRNSGLNQVFIEQAIRSEKTLLINASQLFVALQPQAIILGRMKQNNDFFKKYKPTVLVVSGAQEPLEMRAPRDLENILLI